MAANASFHSWGDQNFHFDFLFELEFDVLSSDNQLCFTKAP